LTIMNLRTSIKAVFGLSLAMVVVSVLTLFADDPTKTAPAGAPAANAPAPPVNEPAMPPPPGLTKISKDFPVWIDLKRKLVVFAGVICLTEGKLKMFECPKGTKEHKSFIAATSDAKTVHAALLAVGAKVGNPVQYDPVYKPAKGT